MGRWPLIALLVGLLSVGCEQSLTGGTTPELIFEPVTRPPSAPEPDAGSADLTWRGLVLAPESRCSPYDADDYRYSPSVEEEIVAVLGGIYSPYTCESFASIRETDIEHIVARSEAHDSGLCAADAATRRAFSNDLRNLTLASPSLNRHQKSDRDAAEWMPERNRCWFAGTVVAVRRAYELTIDEEEAAALDRILAGCVSTTLSCPAGTAVAGE